MGVDHAAGYFLPRLLRFARLRAGLTQRELASRCDVGQPSVVAWESGRRATIEDTLAKVAGALGHANVESFLCAEIPAWTEARAMARGNATEGAERSTGS